MSTSPARYFAPTFFSPYYFPSLVVAGGDAPGFVDSTYRDRDAYAAIITGLATTGEFADVFFGTTPDHRASGADRFPAAVITPNEWVETEDVDPVVVVRQVTYSLTLVVRDEDPIARYEALDRLSRISQLAIDGSDLGGGCLPALTKLRRGHFDSNPRLPEQSVVLQGEFTFLVPSPTA